MISFVCLSFVCLFVYSLCCFFYFTFNMNVFECTPQSVGDFFFLGLVKKRDSLYVYWIVFFIKRKTKKTKTKKSQMHQNIHWPFLFTLIPVGVWTGKMEQTGSALWEMDELYTVAVTLNDISFARFMASRRPAGPRSPPSAPRRLLSLQHSTSHPVWIYAFHFFFFFLIATLIFLFIFHLVPSECFLKDF